MRRMHSMDHLVGLVMVSYRWLGQSDLIVCLIGPVLSLYPPM